MRRIHILEENVSNMIAAGEVVERPASVVKELVENAIDAGATSITVEIKDGGISYIRVTDNGSGMDTEDARISFIRHATSKIASEKDLNSINTLGFRGEALASIASVSEVEMLTKTGDSTYGTKIVIDGGEYKQIESAGCSDGTTIIVKNLFYNTPARLKFLKKESREAAIVSDVLYKLALSQPPISFKFINNNKLVFNTSGDGELKNTILALYGKNLYDSLIQVSYAGNILTITGFIGVPDAARSNRTFQTFFINNRYVKNRMLSTAVDNAYKTFLPVNKFAFCILFVSICPELVDINVHPTKAEIRFQDEKEIFSAVFNTVRNGLAGEVLIPDMGEKEVFHKTEQQQLFKNDYETLPIIRESNQPSYESQTNSDFAHNSILCSKPFHVIKDIKSDSYEKPQVEDTKNLLPPLVIIGQCHYTYILAQGPDALYIIDQHAAHERILYEKYKKAYEDGGIQSQQLIIPFVMELTPGEIAVIKDNCDTISKLGFDFEYFGNNSIILRSVPVIFGEPQLKKLFLEMLDIMETGESRNKNIIDNMIYTMACKSAVKANDKLNTSEMEEIIHKLRVITNPYTCPHGRPTIIKLSSIELEKKFKRIQ